MREMIALAEPAATTQAGLRARIERELRGNILPFWNAHVVDHRKGGIFARIIPDGHKSVDRLPEGWLRDLKSFGGVLYLQQIRARYVK